MKKNTKLISIFCFLFFVGLLINCKSENKLPVYRIGLGPWIGFGTFYLAKEKGYFQDRGLEVELIVITGIAERNSAIQAGSIDALAAPVDYFALSAGNNLEMTIVMAIDESTGGDGIVADTSISKIEDLAGKKVAFQRGLPSEFFFKSILKEYNMDANTIETIDMETAQGGAAFIAKRVDAAVIWEPWLSKAAAEGNGKILASTKDYPDLIVDCIAFSKEHVAQHKGDVQKIVNALFMAVEFWKENPEEANKIMAPYFEISADKYAAILQGASFCDKERNIRYFGDDVQKGPIYHVGERASDIWFESGAIKNKINPESIITTEFVK